MNTRLLGRFVVAVQLLWTLPAQAAEGPFEAAAVRAAANLIGIEFSDREIELMLPGLKEQLGNYEAIRQLPLSNTIPPAMLFNPIPSGFKFDLARRKFRASPPKQVRVPEHRETLAFYSVGELGALIKARKVTSVELTRLYLERLRTLGPRLECVVTVMEDLALRQARRADAELASGKYRGPLHGIPYGAKDLLATKGIPTTWGSAPYTNQVFDFDATVIRRLEQAGAVLVAKTTLGELAWGDVWFAGRTRNPWKLEQGSSGSSAGSASGTAAGLFAFGIGSETYGSIVSPCDRCGVTGLRPSYGRVSRAGAMTLSWSMDKLGPICRTVEDCALVLDTIYGPDPQDPTVYDVPFNYDARLRLGKVRIGYLRADFEKQQGERGEHDRRTLDQVRALGADLLPVELPNLPVGDISFVLSTEGAAAFDDLTRSGRDDWMKRQERASWPNVFREARLVPAVEYLQAQRARYLLVEAMARVFERVDLFLAPSQFGNSLLIGNLTGHPCLVVPNGFTKEGTPTSICFVGKLFDEGTLLAVARRYQESTDHHRKHPVLPAPH